jgi:divalent metal cation (Fe/Co/Zn/Cd) transporter
VLIGVQAVERLHPQPLGDTAIGIAVMLLSLVLTVALLALQYKVIRLTGSTAVRADSLHYRSDLLLNGSILLALLLARLAGRSWMRCSAWASPFTSSGARCRSPAKARRS